jgi:hypothetical protein
VSKEYRNLNTAPNTVFTNEQIHSNPALFAAHVRRIPDYLLAGDWHTESDGNYSFFDGAEESGFHVCGPDLQSFRFV